MKFRQGDTTNITVEFDEPLDGKDLKIGVYRTGTDETMIEALFSDQNSLIKYVGNNTYIMDISHVETRTWVGEFYCDILVKNWDDVDFVNTGEKSIRMPFAPAKIATNLI